MEVVQLESINLGVLKKEVGKKTVISFGSLLAATFFVYGYFLSNLMPSFDNIFFSIVFTLFVLFCLFVSIYFLCWVVLTANKERKLIEETANGVDKLLEKKQNSLDPEEAFNFYRKKFGYFYRKMEVTETVNGKDGSAEGWRRICLVVEDKENILRHKDYHMRIDGKGSEKLWGEAELAELIDGVSCDGDKCFFNTKNGICEYKSSLEYEYEGGLKTKITERNSDNIAFRYSFDKGVGVGTICRYNITEKWPRKTIALSRDDLAERNNFRIGHGKEEMKKECFFVNIVDPVEYLKIRFEFPSSFQNTIFNFRVALTSDSKYEIHSEHKRKISAGILPRAKKSTQPVIYEIELKHPLIGLKYGIDWDPL